MKLSAFVMMMILSSTSFGKMASDAEQCGAAKMNIKMAFVDIESSVERVSVQLLKGAAGQSIDQDGKLDGDAGLKQQMDAEEFERVLAQINEGAINDIRESREQIRLNQLMVKQYCK